jgi:CRP/FNR family transcriptional regulator, cyclic AMP receptor protein
LGYIKYNGKLEIHNSLLNVVLYDKPELKTKDRARRLAGSDSDKAA